VVDKWLKTPHDEQIPLMKETFDFAIHAILSAVFDCDDHHLLNSIHESYNIVSLLHLFFYLFVVLDNRTVLQP